ncbi:hypothetical protein ISF59_02870 [Burkholderia pseudomallei]|nr:hypothetical protein [Burkholderia pseudomallei]
MKLWNETHELTILQSMLGDTREQIVGYWNHSIGIVKQRQPLRPRFGHFARLHFESEQQWLAGIRVMVAARTHAYHRRCVSTKPSDSADAIEF